MVGDYFSTSFAGGRVVPVFALAAPTVAGRFREAIFATSLTSRYAASAAERLACAAVDRHDRPAPSNGVVPRLTIASLPPCPSVSSGKPGDRVDLERRADDEQHAGVAREVLGARDRGRRAGARRT